MIDTQNLDPLEFFSIRNNIINSIGRDNYIQYGIDAVEKSTRLEFLNESAKKFIDLQLPEYKLKLTPDTYNEVMTRLNQRMEGMSKTSGSYKNTRWETFTELVEEITTADLNEYVANKVNDYIMNHDEIKEIYMSLDSDEEHSILSSMLTSVRTSQPEENIIIVKIIL